MPSFNVVELLTAAVPPLKSDSYLDSLSGVLSGFVVGVGVGVTVVCGFPAGVGDGVATVPGTGVTVASGCFASSGISAVLSSVLDWKVRILSYQI